METLVSIILIIGFIYILKKPSHDAHNRLCPPGKRLDYTQMGVDRSNGMSQRDIDIKTNNGGYDIPKWHSYYSVSKKIGYVRTGHWIKSGGFCNGEIV